MIALEEAALKFDNGWLLLIASVFKKRQRDSDIIRDLRQSELG